MSVWHGVTVTPVNESPLPSDSVTTAVSTPKLPHHYSAHVSKIGIKWLMLIIDYSLTESLYSLHWLGEWVIDWICGRERGVNETGLIGHWHRSSLDSWVSYWVSEWVPEPVHVSARLTVSANDSMSESVTHCTLWKFEFVTFNFVLWLLFCSCHRTLDSERVALLLQLVLLLVLDSRVSTATGSGTNNLIVGSIINHLTIVMTWAVFEFDHQNSNTAQVVDPTIRLPIQRLIGCSTFS